ncbi:dihydrofolate reductase family protein [Actinocorallia longicatena]|uniref:Dihydrofolate reductase family protein n=1 Tax=Actinocorallia longicatena TaxID=111803 RepID=A0ABP6Q6V8_9ACTN
MRPLTAHIFMTLDGVAVPDAVIGALAELRDVPEVTTPFFERTAEEDAMLLGRITYQEWAGHWPGLSGHPFADHINAVPKYVVSTTLDRAPWGTGPEATVLSGDAVREVERLKNRAGGPIGLHGSPSLAGFLTHAGLVDELRLEIYPLLAGTGARLFPDGRPPKRLRLLTSRTTSNGVILTSYGAHAA